MLFGTVGCVLLIACGRVVSVPNRVQLPANGAPEGSGRSTLPGAGVRRAILWPAYQAKVKQRKLADAARLYRTRAGHGDADAEYRLGSVYFYGEGASRDYSAAIRWYRKSAEQGLAKAQYALGYCYFYGYGTPRDRAEAGRWYRKAADQGSRMAQCELGTMYAWGEGVPRDEREAVRLFRSAAEKGDALAQRHLGRAYSLGQGLPQSDAEAVRWYRKAAEQGDAPAQWQLGAAYHAGLGVPRDSVLGVRWQLKALGKVVVHCFRRIGWLPPLALSLALIALLLPKRRPGHPGWWSWALLSAATAVQAFHVMSGGFWSGPRRGIAVAVFATLSAACAVMAVIVARREKRPDPGKPANITEEAAAGV